MYPFSMTQERWILDPKEYPQARQRRHFDVIGTTDSTLILAVPRLDGGKRAGEPTYQGTLPGG